MARVAQTECSFLHPFYRLLFFLLLKLTEMFESSHRLILQTAPTAQYSSVRYASYVYKHINNTGYVYKHINNTGYKHINYTGYVYKHIYYTVFKHNV